uniref:(northern house mosquito) hypothetical protein n=1 Tax=Culex pipiens TaxID=7175 RepID=A0A8D8NVG8_CULPI
MEGLFIVCLSMCASIQTSIRKIRCVPSRFGVLHFHFLTHLALIFSSIFYPNREVPTKLIIVVRCVSKPLHKKNAAANKHKSSHNYHSRFLLCYEVSNSEQQ